MNKEKIPGFNWIRQQILAIQERRRYPQTIERARGEEWKQLMTECREIIENPDFDGTKFNRWVSAMIQLLGGQKQSSTSEYGSSFIDPQAGHTIAIHRATEEPWDFGWIDVSRLIDPTAGPRHGNVLVETLKYGEKIGNIDLETMKSFPIMSCSVNSERQGFFLKLHTFDSFILGKRVEWHTNGEIPIETTSLSPKTAQEVCQKVFGVYEKRIPHVRSTTEIMVDISASGKNYRGGIR